MAGSNHQQQQRHRRQRRQDNRLYDRATNDVQLQMQPQFDYNNAQLQQAQENYLRLMQTAQSASGGAFDAIGDAKNPGFDRIANQFTDNLNALAPEFTGQNATMPYQNNSIYGERSGTIGMPANESAAGGALGGAIGAAGFSSLANDDARWGMAREGAQQEASIFGRNQQAALLQNMQDTLQQHENENQNLFAQQPYQIKSRVDDLRDQAIEEQLARSKMRSDKAFAQALMDQINGDLAGSTRPNGRGGNGPGGMPGQNLGGDNHGGNGQWPNQSGYGDTAAGGNNAPPQGNWAGASDQWARPREVMSAVRTAQSRADLPGWVRYAYNHQGADPAADPQVLQNDARRQLYNRKIAPYLQKHHGPTWPKGT